jgi:hypothetical protein
MAKATLTLRNGTTVTIEGDVTEVQRLLEVYDQPARPRQREDTAPKGARSSRRAREHEPAPVGPQPNEIANATKDCPESTAMEKHILDGRSQLNRVLLPLYVVSQYLDGRYALVMSEISQATRDLGALVEPTNVAKVMRTVGGRFVMAEGGRGRGERRFRISRRGIDHVKSVLKGNPE